MDGHWWARQIRGWGERPALIWRGDLWSYTQLCDATDVWLGELARRGVKPGSALAICGNYSPKLCGLLFAAMLNCNIIVPLSSATARQWDHMLDVAEVEFSVDVEDDDSWRFAKFGRVVSHPLLRQLVERGAPGVVLFSSGSTGDSKASILDFDRLLAKFRAPRPSYRTLVFLLFDHIGGINTLLHTLIHGGTVVTTDDRRPDAVCAAVDRHRDQLLPATPTFLRMLVIAEAAKRYDLGSLEIISYGTEPMPASTLAAVRETLPWVRLKQTYGLSELGILQTQSPNSDLLWLKLGFEHRIVDGVLWIRSQTAMLGYLNAPSPFESGGWFNTQDLVEANGEYIRILGRKSELINVGGEKVHPTEIENVMLQIENVKDVTVRGKPNPITGEVVTAKITLVREEDPTLFRQRVRAFCRERLERYKVPAVIEMVDEDHHGIRFKKSRKAAAEVDPPSIE